MYHIKEWARQEFVTGYIYFCLEDYRTQMGEEDSLRYIDAKGNRQTITLPEMKPGQRYDISIPNINDQVKFDICRPDGGSCLNY